MSIGIIWKDAFDDALHNSYYTMLDLLIIGYTMAAHLETVPELQNNDYKDLEYTKFQAYAAFMADELFLKVRQDPGVKSVHQVSGVEFD